MGNSVVRVKPPLRQALQTVGQAGKASLSTAMGELLHNTARWSALAGSLIVQQAKSSWPQPSLTHEFETDSRHLAFTFSVIGLAAHLSMLDGQPKRQEYMALLEAFPLRERGHSAIRRIYDLACSDPSSAELHARRIAMLFPEQKPLCREVMQRLFRIALADGKPSIAELRYLGRVAGWLGMGRLEFGHLMRMELRRGSDPYALLEVSRHASRDQIKAAYRRLARRCHPDMLVSQNASADAMELAALRMAELNKAYQLLGK